MEEQKSSEMNFRKPWTVAETKAFLSCYSARKHEFSDLLKKQDAYQNIVDDLNALGIMTTIVTSDILENKLNALIRAYKTIVDNNKLPECTTKTVDPFGEQLEGIFGEGMFSVENMDHLLSIGIDLSKEPVESPKRLASSSTKSNAKVEPEHNSSTEETQSSSSSSSSSSDISESDTTQSGTNTTVERESSNSQPESKADTKDEPLVDDDYIEYCSPSMKKRKMAQHKLLEDEIKYVEETESNKLKVWQEKRKILLRMKQNNMIGIRRKK